MKIQIVKNDNGYQVRRKRFLFWWYWSKGWGSFCMGKDYFNLTKSEATNIFDRAVAEEAKLIPSKTQIIQETRSEDLPLIQARQFTIAP